MSEPIPDPEPDDVLAVVADRWKRLVILTRRGLAHVHDGHREVAERDIKLAIQRAEIRLPGNVERREELWARGVGRSRWFLVVVAYDVKEGVVVTARQAKKGPEGEG